MKKEGSVRKRGNNIEIRIWINGKQKSFYGKTEAEARRKIREYRNKEELNESPKQEKGTAIFGEYVYNYLFKYKYQKIKDSAFDILERVYFNQLNKYDISNLPLNQLTIDNMQQYINEIDKKYYKIKQKQQRQKRTRSFSGGRCQDLQRDSGFLKSYVLCQ